MFVEKAIFNASTIHDSNSSQVLPYKNTSCISAKTKSFKKGNNIILTTKCIHIFIWLQPFLGVRYIPKSLPNMYIHTFQMLLCVNSCKKHNVVEHSVQKPIKSQG